MRCRWTSDYCNRTCASKQRQWSGYRLPLLAAILTLPLVSRSLAAPPNIVLIVADDLGWADLGCYCRMFHKTRHLDRLAAESVRFTNAYAAGGRRNKPEISMSFPVATPLSAR
jgi:hypothetical protein